MTRSDPAGPPPRRRRRGTPPPPERPPRRPPPQFDEEEYEPYPPPRQPRVTVTRVAATRTKELTGRAVRRINAASRAEGAGESGLTSLIWTNATHMAGDAMIAVCLAGTIFFGAATGGAKPQLALYLLITMAPFALVAPFLGPLLDRMHHGRRLALAITLLGRAVMAWIMAGNFDNIALYPAAFGALVLSKAFGVLKGACVPRVLPDKMTLVAANSRLSLFGLAGSIVCGGLLVGFIKLSDSYPWALRITMAVFVIAAIQALRLPKYVDSSAGEVKAPVVRATAGTAKVRPGLGTHVVTALRAASAIRALAGFLTIYMAFYIKETYDGWEGVLALGALAGAMMGGSVLGTSAGARMKMGRPDAVVLVGIGATAGACVFAAVSFSQLTTVIVASVGSLSNSLGKMSLDAIIQREIPDSMRASAFGKSETFLQLSWVLGGGLGLAPLESQPQIAFAIAAVLLVGAFLFTMRGRHAPDPAPA